MMNKHITEMNFYGGYETADLLKKLFDDENYASSEIEWFVHELSESKDGLLPLAKFRKRTILHEFILYCLERAFGAQFRDMRKCGLTSICTFNCWTSILDAYEVKYSEIGLTEDDESCGEIEVSRVEGWVDHNYDNMLTAWAKMAEEAFHILFRDRLAMQSFHKLLSEQIECPDYLKEHKTKKGRVERCSIPAWAKRAIVFRDMGCCVFCGKDLTGIFNLWARENFDHIVPLGKYGANDPTNLQLLCRECNAEKLDHNCKTSSQYAKWW
jgi:hypothetical protein